MQWGRRPMSRQPRTHPLPGWRMSGGTCGMAVDGLGIVGSLLRRIPRPSTAIPQVPPVLLHCSLRENNLRRGFALVDRTCYISSDGMYLAEQTDLVDQRGYVDRGGEASS